MATAGQDPKEPSGWHLKKEIQLGHLVTTLAVAGSALMYVNKLDQRISLIEQKETSQKELAEIQARATADAVGILRNQLDRMDSKLDHLVEGRR